MASPANGYSQHTDTRRLTLRNYHKFEKDRKLRPRRPFRPGSSHMCGVGSATASSPGTLSSGMGCRSNRSKRHLGKGSSSGLLTLRCVCDTCKRIEALAEHPCDLEGQISLHGSFRKIGRPPR